MAVAVRTDAYGVGMLVRLAAATGARRGELVALRWKHVDFERGTVRFDTSAFAEHGERIEKSTKTRSTRVVTLDKGTVETLRAAELHSKHSWATAGVEWKSDATFWSSHWASRGRRIPLRCAGRWFVSECRAPKGFVFTTFAIGKPRPSSTPACRFRPSPRGSVTVI